MIPDILGYTYKQAQSILKSSGIDYLVDIYKSPKSNDNQDISDTSIVTQVVLGDNNKIKLVLCNF